MSLRTDEPVALYGALAAVPPAVQGVLTAFGAWAPTPEQLTALSGLYVAVLGVLAVFARRRVTPYNGVPADPDYLDQLALAAYAEVDGVDEADGEDLHALDAPHGVNDPAGQG